VVFITIALSFLEPQIASQQTRAIDEKKVELLDALTSVTAPGADRERRHMWTQTGRLIQDHILLGVGVGNWKHIYPIYDGGVMLRPGSAPERPHNDFIWIWSEVGTIGLAAYLWLLVAIPFAVLRILKRTKDSEEAYLAVAICASLVATLGHSLFSFPRDLAGTSLIFWTGLAVLSLLDRPRKLEATPTTKPGMLKVLVVTTVLLTSATILFTYRHIRFDAHYLRANQFHNGGDFRSMLKESTDGLAFGPFDAQAYLFQGKGYHALGMLGMALESVGTGLVYHPHSTELLGDMGRYYAEIDSLNAAETTLRRALELSPTSYQMYNNLGGVYQKGGKLEAAIGAYRQALEYDSTDVGTLNNLGLAQMEFGLLEDAIYSFGRAVELAPNELWIHHNVGDALFRKSAEDVEALRGSVEAYKTFLRIATSLELPGNLTETARKRINEITDYLGDRN